MSYRPKLSEWWCIWKKISGNSNVNFYSIWLQSTVEMMTWQSWTHTAPHYLADPSSRSISDMMSLNKTATNTPSLQNNWHFKLDLWLGSRFSLAYYLANIALVLTRCFHKSPMKSFSGHFGFYSHQASICSSWTQFYVPLSLTSLEQ